MADYAFGEVTRLLYEAIWNEYCDWGLELAKVRLADASLTDAQREATWWALVEALDTYLRLLHPVMPFITERLWAGAAAPGDGPRPAHRGPLARRRRSATRRPRPMSGRSWSSSGRSATRVPTRGSSPPRGSPLDVYVEPELGPALEALRPAIERLARARPLRRQLTREALHGTAGAAGGLAVIAGPAEAVVGPRTADPAAVEADRARLEKELADAERQLAAARARLANEAFMAKAPPAIVEGARASEAELADQVGRIRERLDR